MRMGIQACEFWQLSARHPANQRPGHRNRHRHRPASTVAMRRLMSTNPSEFDSRKFFGATVTAMCDVCIARYEAFDTAGNGSKIKPISLEAMYQRYLKGELNAKVN